MHPDPAIEPGLSEAPTSMRIDWMRVSTVGTFFLLLIAFLRVSEPVLLPVCLALMLMLIFSPFVDFLGRRLRFPRFLAATSVVLAIATIGIVGLYYLTGPVKRYLVKLDDDKVRTRLSEMVSPVKNIHTEITAVVGRVQDLPKDQVAKVKEDADAKIAEEEAEARREEAKKVGEEPVAGNIESKTQVRTTVKTEVVDKEGTSSPPAEEKTQATVDVTSTKPVTVNVKEDPVAAIYTSLSSFGAYFLSTLILFLFLLAYGDRMAERMGQARGTPELLVEVKRDVSNYLFTITYINIGLGLCIWISLAALGLKDAYLFGLMAALLNFIPYAGAVIGTAITILIAAMDMASVPFALGAGAIYFGLSSIEGNVVTPAIIGKKFEINPVIVFLWVLVWAALWGLPGMLIGLPMLMGCRILCAHIPSLRALERMITL